MRGEGGKTVAYSCPYVQASMTAANDDAEGLLARVMAEKEGLEMQRVRDDDDDCLLESVSHEEDAPISLAHDAAACKLYQYLHSCSSPGDVNATSVLTFPFPSLSARHPPSCDPAALLRLSPLLHRQVASYLISIGVLSLFCCTPLSP